MLLPLIGGAGAKPHHHCDPGLTLGAHRQRQRLIVRRLPTGGIERGRIVLIDDGEAGRKLKPEPDGPRAFAAIAMFNGVGEKFLDHNQGP